jgi:hypothetical protein
MRHAAAVRLSRTARLIRQTDQWRRAAAVNRRAVDLHRVGGADIRPPNGRVGGRKSAGDFSGGDLAATRVANVDGGGAPPVTVTVSCSEPTVISALMAVPKARLSCSFRLRPHSQDSDVVVDGQPRDLHPFVRDEIYNDAAEALRNAFLHARAGRGQRRHPLRRGSNSDCARATMARGSMRRCSQARGWRDTTDCAACEKVWRLAANIVYTISRRHPGGHGCWARRPPAPVGDAP